ncbi:nucleotide-binding alpha-beta plait domain-containing protein [Tanacetum coccineum]
MVEEEEKGQNQLTFKIGELTYEEKEDRISLLPDCLLLEFISRLPSTKEAIRTGTLSKRWQHLWTQVHNLIFEHHGQNHLLGDFFSFVDKTLTQCRHLNLNEFKLITRYDTQFELQVNNCIRYAVNCNVQHLDLTLWNTNDDIGFEFEICSDFFFANPCFTNLSLTGFKLNPIGSISWNKLTRLSLLEGNLEEHVFQNILSGSPLLETLLIRNCYGFKRIDITSKSVKNFVFYGYMSPGEDLDDIIEINAPYIVSLEIKGVFYLSKLSLLNVSSLVQAHLDYTNEFDETPILEYEVEMLEGFILSLRHVKELKIGDTLIEGFCFLFNMGDRRPKENGVYNISTSIFITNFPDQTNAKKLWRLYNQYGNVIDSFIPNRRSKVGKRFGFVRFIKIYDVERLVNNLCTIWIENFKLHVNIAKFNRTPLHKGNHLPNIHATVRPAPVVSSKTHGDSSSYIQAVKAGVNLHSVVSDVKVSKPALLLDDSCLNVSDYSLSLVGKLKEFSSLPNLKMLLVEEGFTDLTISYLGGFWVSFQFLSKTSKENFMSHVGVNSWFIKILQGSSSFVVDERVTWIDIEGVPLCVWSHNTFSRIASIWGSLLYDEDEAILIQTSPFHRKAFVHKKLHSMTLSLILSKSLSRQVFWIRAKELTGWAPIICTKDASASYDESVDSKLVIIHKESHLENMIDVTNESPKDHYEDPFNIYNLLNKKNPEKPVVQQSAGDLKFPPGFTPSGDVNQECTLPVHDKDTMASYKEDTNVSSCSGHFHKVKSPKTGGSMLQVIEDLIKVGQTMGYKMEGCMKDIEEIVNSQGVHEFFK